MLDIIGEGGTVSHVVTYHPALNGIRKAVGKLQPMLAASEERKRVFPEQPLVAFRRASNLKDNLARAKLPPVPGDSVKGCFRCGKSRCQVCKLCMLCVCLKEISLSVTLRVRSIR